LRQALPGASGATGPLNSPGADSSTQAGLNSLSGEAAGAPSYG